MPFIWSPLHIVLAILISPFIIPATAILLTLLSAIFSPAAICIRNLCPFFLTNQSRAAYYERAPNEEPLEV